MQCKIPYGIIQFSITFLGEFDSVKHRLVRFMDGQTHVGHVHCTYKASAFDKIYVRFCSFFFLQVHRVIITDPENRNKMADVNQP